MTVFLSLSAWWWRITFFLSAFTLVMKITKYAQCIRLTNSRRNFAHANATTQDLLLETLFTETLHPLASYRHQLNFLNIIAPEMILALDESAAGKALTPEWVRFQLETPDLYPEVESLYVIHAVYDTENDPPTMFWFHTHGLARCGLTEVDLVIPVCLSLTMVFWSLPLLC